MTDLSEVEPVAAHDAGTVPSFGFGRKDHRVFPCLGELKQRCDPRDVDREEAVIEWQRQTIVQQHQLRAAGLL